MKRWISFLMVLAMLLSTGSPIVTPVFAAEDKVIEVGYSETITFTEEKNTVSYSFTPSKSGTYMLSRWNWGGSYGELQVLYSGTYISAVSGSFDYNGVWYTFVEAEAGETYSITITQMEPTDQFNFSLNFAPELEDISFRQDEYTLYYCDHEDSGLCNEGYLTLELEPYDAYDTIVSVDTGSDLVQADAWIHGVNLFYSGCVDTTITVQTASGKTAQCELHIVQAPEVESLYIDGLDPATAYAPGDWVAFFVDSLPEGSCDSISEYNSSNPEVAELIPNGRAGFMLKIQDYGTTVITFADEYGHSVEHRIEVGCTGEHTIVVEPAVEVSCTEDGMTEGKYCSTCGQVFAEQEVIEAKGHSWSKWAMILEPTSDAEGRRRRKCSVCGKVEAQVVEKLGAEFNDVAETDYFALPVNWAVQNNITNGIAEGQFGPNQNCTRAQVVTFLWRASGEPEPASSSNPFTDVKAGEYYYKAVLWAVEKGITKGMTATEFGTNDTCTRAQVATFLWRAQNEPKPAGTGEKFSDVAKDAWYETAVLWAVENGVTNGVGNGTFAPEDTCTRGQIVTFLYRAIS